MAFQIELLETSFQLMAPRGEALVTAFYERLFTRFPETRAFFASTNMREQRKNLLGALDLVIQNLRRPDVLTSPSRAWASGTSPMASGQSTIPSSEPSCWKPSPTC